MNAVIYMLKKTVKNGILDILRHPAQLAVYIFIVLSTVGGIVSALTSNVGTEQEFFDLRILQAAYLLILYFISVPIMLKGTNSSTTFFKLSDAANIFTAPISEKQVLVYGVGKQMATILLLLLCFISYGTMAVQYFSLTIWDAVWLLLGIAVMLFEVQLVTILIFCLCSGRPKRIRIMKYLIYLLVIIPIAAVLFELFSNGLTYESILSAASRPYFSYIPLTGWTSGMFMGIVTGNLRSVLICGGFLLVFSVFAITVFMMSKPDYYENVLQKTESVYEWRNAIKTGTVSDKNMMSEKKKVKLGRTGINKGKGASTFFYKQLREMSRRSRIPFLNINTAVLISFVIVVGFLVKAFGSEIVSPSMIMTMAAILSCYIQFFFTVSDDWVMELQKPYIFIIPASPVKKLIAACATSVIKPLIDGTIAFTIGGIVFSANAADIFGCITLYFSCGLMYTSLNVLVQRFMGRAGNRGILMVVYVILLFIALLPGIIVSAVLFITSASQLSYLSFLAARLCLPAAICNFIIAFLVFLISKRTLNNMEF